MENRQSRSLIILHLPVRYDLNQSRAFQVTPKHSVSLLKRIVCSMVSKEAGRSTKVNVMTLPSSSDDRVSINQSINQSSFYSANIPGKARLSGATSESAFNSKIEETVPLHQQAMGMPLSMGDRPSQRDVSSDVS